MTIKNRPSKEELERNYEELKSAVKIGKKYNVNQVTIINWMKNYGINIRKSTYQISLEKKPCKEELEKAYEELKSIRKVGELYKVCIKTAHRWLKKDGIIIRKSHKEISKEKKPAREELEAKYREFGSTLAIGKAYGVSASTAGKWLHKDNITIKKSTVQIRLEKKPSKQELEEKCKELGSLTKVGEFYKVSIGTAFRWLKKDGIEISEKPPKEELELKYEELGSTISLGRLYGVSHETAGRWLRGYGIKVGPDKNSLENTVDLYLGAGK
jgi:transposase-like protein